MKKIFNPLIHIDFAKYKYLIIKDKRDFKKKVIKCIKITEGKKKKIKCIRRRNPNRNKVY